METPYYHLPQGYSDTYRSALVPSSEAPNWSPAHPTALPKPAPRLPREAPNAPFGSELLPAPQPDRQDMPILGAGYLRETSEESAADPRFVPGSDVEVVIPPEVQRAASLRSIPLPDGMIDFDILPPSP